MGLQGQAGAGAAAPSPSDSSASDFTGDDWYASKRRVRHFSLTSPVARVVMMMTFAFYCGLVLLDSTTSLLGTESRLEVEARLLAVHLADADHETGQQLLAELAHNLGAGTTAELSDRNPQGVEPVVKAEANFLTLPSSLEARRYIAGPLNEVVVSEPILTVLTPVAQRALAAAIALSTLLYFVLRTLRTRQSRIINQASFDELLADIPSGIACWSPEGLLIAANSAFRNKLGAQRAALKPGSRHADTIQNIDALTARALVAEGQGYRRSHITLADGSPASLEEVYSSDGALVMMICDRAEHEQLEMKLTEERYRSKQLAQSLQEQQLAAGAAKRSTKAFLAHLNHEIRTPLNHIIGFADLIRHQSYGPLGDRRYVTYVGHIMQSGENLLSAITKMLELADFEAGQTNLKKERIPAGNLIAWAGQRYSDMASRARIKLNVNSECDMVLTADQLCLQRMLSNVVENALRYTPAGGEVTLATWTASDGVVFEISDTGIGIPPEQLALLSNSFTLGASSFKLDQSRTGMGIAVARAIAEISGGQLAIDSSPSIGTTVAISLPAEARSEAARQQAA